MKPYTVVLAWAWVFVLTAQAIKGLNGPVPKLLLILLPLFLWLGLLHGARVAWWAVCGVCLYHFGTDMYALFEGSQVHAVAQTVWYGISSAVLIIDPSMLTVTPGTTRDEGGVEFRALVDELAPAAAKPLSGSAEWTCRS